MALKKNGGATDLAAGDIVSGGMYTLAFDGTNLQVLELGGFGPGLSQIGGLVDPNADRLLFWDDSAGTWAFLTLGTNLSITDTTINAAGGKTVIASGSFAATNSQVIATDIPAIYSHLALRYDGLSSNTATRRPLFQFSTTNGVSYDTTVTNYQGMYFENGATLEATDDASVFWHDDQAASGVFSGTLYVFGYQGGLFPKYSSFGSQTSLGAIFVEGFYVGSVSAINAMRMIWSGTGNSDGTSSFTLYGIA